MRYLRMLTNSVAGGALGAAYMTILVLQLNPAFPFVPRALVWLYLSLALFYGVHLAAAFYVLIVLRQLFATEVLSPGWISVRLLAWLNAGVASSAALLMWFNVSGFRAVLERDTAQRMALGAFAMSASAVALLTIATAHYSLGRRGSRVSAAILALAVIGSLVLPTAARGPGHPWPAGTGTAEVAEIPATVVPARVTMIVLDGASLEYVSLAAAEGRLPNLGLILDAGAVMHLATIRPTQPGVVWTAVATGKFPPKNGVRSAATYAVRRVGDSIELLPDHCFSSALVHLGIFTEVPHTSASVRARTLWDILGAAGMPVGVVGWPLTYPARPVRGYLVSDRLHLATTASRFALDDTRLAYPSELVTSVRPAAEAAVKDQQGDLLLVSERAIGGRTEMDPSPLARDRYYAEIAARLERRVGPRLIANRYQGVDVVGHYFLRYALPRSFGDVSDEERRTYGNVLERYYAYIDARVGEAITSLRSDDLLLVVSGFGMEPVSLPKRLLARAAGDPDVTGTHERAPDGFVLAYGSMVAAGRPPLGSVFDVTPTVLYYLGLPVGRDMDGYARTDLFKRAFTAERPITFIPTYEP